MATREIRIVDERSEAAFQAIKFWRGALLQPFFVYFVQEDEGDEVKIGKAQDPHKRLLELQCGNPRVLRIRAVLLAQPEAEGILHRQFDQFRMSGEWFGYGMAHAIVGAAQHVMGRQILMHKQGVPYQTVLALATELGFE